MKSYETAGPAGAPPIVLLHGIGVTRKQWLPQLRDLADEYRLIAVDLPGHGSLAQQRFSLDDAAAHVASMIEEEAGGRALVAGLSLGGYVAIELARTQPERVAGLVLTGCSANPRGVLTVIPNTVRLFTRAVGGRWLTMVNEVNFRARYGDELATEQVEAGFFFHAVQDALRALGGKNFLNKLREYAGPVLILNGERDSLYRIEEVLFLMAARDGMLQIVRGAGHVANLEAPDAYTRALRRFARSIEWGASAEPRT